MTDEPLSLIAPLAAKTGEQHCRNDEGSGSCAWYHGTLDYLRLLDLVISPHAHRDFFVPAFQGLAEGSSSHRVLVSGAGDCSMMTQVLSGFRAASVEPDITVIDRCETPLILNRWLAEREGLSIETAQSEVLDFETSHPFDVICTHCFLGYFTSEVRPRVADKWFSLLRPGGRLLTINPIRNTPDDSLVRFTPEQAASFGERALRAAQSRPDLFGTDLDWFRKRVGEYARNFGSYPVRSAEDFRSLFEKAGFSVERMSPLSLPGTPVSASSGPTELGLLFMSVVAVRP
ncbi:MAG: class I SAM-dependent methyltransferase [Rhodospirillales bacterium]|nr:class I SAM-dependent methyltransferase [Rhodospirillales bacterium]